MSSYTSSTKQHLTTWLDDIGLLLGLPRLEEESLLDYRNRLIDHSRNRGNSSRTGLNNSIMRNLGETRKHIFSLSTTNISKPYIKVTSKFLKLYEDEELLEQIDITTISLGELNTLLSLSDNFIVDYYNDDYENESAKKILLCHNRKNVPAKALGSSKLNSLGYTYIDKLFFGGNAHFISKNSIEELESKNDFHLDFENGLLYTFVNAKDIVTFDYFEIPFKLYWSPISYFPMSDEDIDYHIKDILYTENGEEYLSLNYKGAQYINELLSVHPLTFGE